MSKNTLAEQTQAVIKAAQRLSQCSSELVLLALKLNSPEDVDTLDGDFFTLMASECAEALFEADDAFEWDDDGPPDDDDDGLPLSHVEVSYLKVVNG